ncbi:MAG: radical SAM protein [Elusimicrobia bacterium]|nr:radical SAM protein [Elusimicrobiota bacterium]
MRIHALAAPTMVTWQLTRDCDLACLHCCTDSAPGKALAGELSRGRALSLCAEIVAANVPYAMIAGGEPTLVPHFAEVCRTLSDGGVLLKIETNGQNFDANFLKGLGVRSVQISLDGASQAVYGRQRINGILEKAVTACRATIAAGFPLEITFAPTRLNIFEAEAVIDLAASLGAFRFNTGQLMRLGTAARLWDRLEPSKSEYAAFLRVLERKERELAGRMELCYKPFSLEEEMAHRALHPSGALLVLPDGRVKVAAPLPFTCADLKTQTFLEAWESYKTAWADARVRAALEALAAEPEGAARANQWVALNQEALNAMPAVV